MLYFRKNPVAKIFRIRRGWEHQDSPSNFFFITAPKNFIDEPFSVSLISGIEKLYASEGHVTIFPRKFFVSQCRKSPKRNRSVLCFSKFPVAKNFWMRRGGSIKILRRKFFCVAVPKYFVGEPFIVSLFSVIGKSYASEGYVTIFC